MEIRLASGSRAAAGRVLRSFDDARCFPTLTLGDSVFHEGQRYRLVARETHLERDGTTIMYAVAPLVRRGVTVGP
ncbi:hypothetical protein ACIBG8_54235 [Nonomuraea sp. NPDC050556]|uniref:hypothetical protein n=1 Tax=Nonomuraea sp. NPDC050556 TaxID=3364369 RepID=UPI0037B95BF6